MKTALIVGASRGLGREFVRQYRRDGWNVIATARDDASLDALRARRAGPCARHHAARADRGARLEARRRAASMRPCWCRCTGRAPRVETVTAEDFDAVMHTNVRGPMQLLPIVLPLVEDARGVLAVVSSRMGSIAEATGTTGWLYRASKAALNDALRIASLQTRHAACISPIRLGAHRHGRRAGRDRPGNQRGRHAPRDRRIGRGRVAGKRPFLPVRRYRAELVSW